MEIKTLGIISQLSQVEIPKYQLTNQLALNPIEGLNLKKMHRFTFKLLSIALFFLLVSIVNHNVYAAVSGPFKECHAKKTPVNINENVEIVIETDPYKLEGWINIDGPQSRDQFIDKESSAKTTRTINVGSFTQQGVYSLSVLNVNSDDAASGTTCEVDTAFAVGDSSTGGITLEEPSPSTPIFEEFKTLPRLIISGLTSGNEYEIRLAGGWDGGKLSHSGDNTWRANSDGKITAENICDNGEGDRTDCTENYNNQIYEMKVYDLASGDKVEPSLYFEVNTEAQFVNGKNPCSETSCETAFGSIPTEPKGFIEKILTISLGLAGGIALIFMVWGSIKVLMSSGDPKRVAEGREMIVAAIAGTLFIIFSVLILRFVAKELLNIDL